MSEKTKPPCFGNQECYNIPCEGMNPVKCPYKKECYIETMNELHKICWEDEPKEDVKKE